MQIFATAGFTCNPRLEPDDFSPQPVCARLDQRFPGRPSLLCGRPCQVRLLASGALIQRAPETSSVTHIAAGLTVCHALRCRSLPAGLSRYCCQTQVLTDSAHIGYDQRNPVAHATQRQLEQWTGSAAHQHRCHVHQQLIQQAGL